MLGTKPGTARRIGVRAGAVGLLLLCAGAQAEAKSLRAQLKPYCMSDYLRLCDSTAITRASIVSCFKRNISSVSARCKRAVDNRTEFNPSRIERRRN